MKRIRCAAPILLLAALAPASARSDAMVRTQAMSATTIAEFFVEDDRVRAELEIGLADLEAFRNLLPDELYEKLGHPRRPWAERVPEFFREDLVLAVEEGAPLPGRVVAIAARPRVRRDEISGEPLPQGEGDVELVVFAELEYALPAKPATLTFSAPSGPKTASVGFVVYHHKIPVNDFRYLSPRQTLELDWEDPWYSAFRSRTLRRQYFAPMSGFVYVEPFEVRKEIVVRPLDLQHWIDLGLAGRRTIPVAMQGELKRRVAAFLREHHPVRIDGDVAPEPELAQINFLERTLTTSRVVDPPVELDVYSAILGVIFVYPTDGFPERVTMEWDLWNERTPRIPAASVDQAGPLPILLEPDFRVLEWRNFLKVPVLPTLRVLAPPPSALARWLRPLRWLFLAGALAVLWWCRSAPRQRVFAAFASLVLVAGSFWLSRDADLSEERTRELVSGLLHNVYRAFDFRGEEQIYDTLARSVDGELLVQTYLETRRGLELANQGGARAKVKEIELIDLVAEPAEGGGFVATAVWNVAGSVGHWGHVHQRRNRYRAELRIAPVAGSWKLVGLEVLEEERI